MIKKQKKSEITETTTNAICQWYAEFCLVEESLCFGSPSVEMILSGRRVGCEEV